MVEKSEVELNAKLEAEKDLTKSIPQLVCDFHIEAEKALRRGSVLDDTKYMLNAQKRMVAMMGQVAMKNDEVNKNLIHLTGRMTWFTIAIFFLGIASLLFSVFSWFYLVKTLP